MTTEVLGSVFNPWKYKHGSASTLRTSSIYATRQCNGHALCIASLAAPHNNRRLIPTYAVNASRMVKV